MSVMSGLSHPMILQPRCVGHECLCLDGHEVQAGLVVNVRSAKMHRLHRLQIPFLGSDFHLVCSTCYQVFVPKCIDALAGGHR